MENTRFNFIANSDERIIYITAYSAITQLNYWEIMKMNPGPGGFILANISEFDIIYDKIRELGYARYSGASFSFVMQDMQIIARYGYDFFRQVYCQ